jgi:serine/threonine protein kinase
VFKGVWLESTTVALKLIQHKKDFLREESLLRLVNHPNIVKYLGRYEEKEKLFLVTEWLSEGNLANFVRRKASSLHIADLLGMARQSAAALRYFEEVSIIHRDLALRNLLVTKGGDENYLVKIADFGMR